MIFTEKNYYYFGKQYNLKSDKKENGLNCVYKWSDLIINVVYYIFKKNSIHGNKTWKTW